LLPLSLAVGAAGVAARADVEVEVERDSTYAEAIREAQMLLQEGILTQVWLCS
jgi:hypothetical protein